MTDSVDVTRGADLEIAFAGSPGRVQSFNYDDEFGLMLEDVDPEIALDLMAMDPSVESSWAALRTVLVALGESGCNTAEIADYLATAKCGLSPDEWAELTDGNERTVKRNAKTAAGNLRC